MKNLKHARRPLVVLALIGLVAPPPAMSQTVAPSVLQRQPAPVTDQALGQGGVLRGQVVSSEGVGQPDRLVTLQSGAREVATVRTDEQGRFAFIGLRSGLYMLSTEDASAVIRAWSAEVAPPSAQQGVLLTTDDQIARGQLADGQFTPGGGQFFTPATISALITAGIIGGAVAIVSEDSASGS